MKKYSKSFKIVFVLVVVCFLVFLYFALTVGASGFYNAAKDQDVSFGLRICTDPEDTYYVHEEKNNGETTKRLYNFVDGYNLALSNDFSIDMTRSDVYALLTSDTTRIEIYRQRTPTQEDKDSYIGYSNGFAANEIDHKVTIMETQKFGSNYAHVTAWEREKSSVIEPDYNHYVTLDILMRSNVYSIFIKSTEPIKKKDYEYMASSFAMFPITVKYEAAKTVAPDVADKNWNQETKDFYTKYFQDDASLTWGIFEPQFAYFDFANYKALEERLGYNFPVMVWYNHITKEPEVDYWQSLLNESYQRGKILELTLQTPLTEEGQGNMVYDVLDGQYDEYLTKYAETIGEFDHPVLFRLANEMNGDWCPYSGYQTSKDTLIYKEFYRYIYNIFTEKQVDNVIWVWNPNGESKPGFTWNHALMYYPGDEYVDVVGLTAYNTGNYYHKVGERWQTFSELYEQLYADYCNWFGQPLMITEFASASKGGDKAAWITDMFKEMKNYPRIKMAIWWDGCDYDVDGSVSRSYVLDESKAVLDAFYQGLKSQR